MTEKFNDEEELQVKSKERVKDFGEVFTNQREVNAMLDLVKDESYRVDSRFLEPACGNGNFLVTILERKLETVEKEHSANQVDFEKQALVAVSTIYAIDIQEDNCQESRHRMFEIVENSYNKVYPESKDSYFLTAVKYLLDRNIIHGDGLTGLREDAEGAPIEFSEWTFDYEDLKVKEFAMNDMVAHGKREAMNEENMKKESNSLFNLGGIVAEKEELKPVHEYTIENYKKFFANYRRLRLRL